MGPVEWDGQFLHRDDGSFCLCCTRARRNTRLTVSGCGSRAFTSSRAVTVENDKI